MLQKLAAKVRRFMSGRNGVDTLSWVLCVLGVVLNLVGTLFRLTLCTLLAYVPLIWSLVRIFSRDLVRRRQENQKFLQMLRRIRGRKEHCYFKCPGCKTRVRVPRGKGTLRITCPNCHEAFMKKT